ncbi:hypothetical protein BGX29_009288 [Mortierella sp. GBA35]|nr:hypothetical protein BGX29_009288 [Mortierella sp. GBA35]
MTVQGNKNNNNNNKSIKYPTKMPTAVFLDSGGVINDNAKRAPQWLQYLGEFLPTTVLGGNAQIWGMANVQMIGPFFRRWYDFMAEATQLAAQAQARTIAKGQARGEVQEEQRDEEEEEAAEETNVYRIFERLHLLVWIKEMCRIASGQLPDLNTKILPALTDDDLFRLARSAHVFAIQRVRADFPGAVGAIREIKAMTGMRLFTSSGDGFEDLEWILKGLGVFEEFDGVFGSDRVNCLKNSPEYYGRVFAKVGVRVISRKDKEDDKDTAANGHQARRKVDNNEKEKGDEQEEEEDDAVKDDDDGQRDEVVVVDDSEKALKWARVHGARTVLIIDGKEGELDLSLEMYSHIDYQLKALSELPVLLDSWKQHFSAL